MAESLFKIKAETKKKIKEIATIVFISGETKMWLAWVMFIVGVTIGAFMF